MRILHISTRLILGGSQENTVLSCEEQTRRGHEVHLAFGPIYGPEGSLLERVEKFATPDGRKIATHVVPSLVRDVNPSKDARARHELRELIERLKPDVVHTHSSKAGILGRFAAWESNPRPTVVHTIHGPPFMPIEGGVFKRLKTRVLNLAFTLAERKAALCCHGIISVADAMTREFLRRKIGKPEQYTTVRSGIEQGAYLVPSPEESRDEVRRAIGVGLDDFVVGTVARLAEHKGHDDLLEALGARLKADARWKLLWVGDGWWRERLISRARAMGLGVRELDREGTSSEAAGRDEEGIEGRGITARGEEVDSQRLAQVICTGLVPPMSVPGLIRAMDTLAHPSSREGLPRTVPQALLSGVCPVAYDVDGTGEACVEMVTGRLVPAGDIQKLREAIEWCESHPAERQALANAGRERCIREFSVSAMVDGLDRAYDKAAATKQGRS